MVNVRKEHNHDLYGNPCFQSTVKLDGATVVVHNETCPLRAAHAAIEHACVHEWLTRFDDPREAVNLPVSIPGRSAEPTQHSHGQQIPLFT